MDQTITIPWWAVLFFTGIVLPWMLYLTRKDNLNTQGIALLKHSFEDIEQDIRDLRENFDKRMDKNDHRMERMEEKVEKIYDLLHAIKNNGRRGQSQ